MVIRPNQHLVLANRRSGQEPLYVHTSPLGMLRLQATKGSASFRSRLLDHRSCLSNISVSLHSRSLPNPQRWVSYENPRNPRATRGRDQNWTHRYDRKACEKLGSRSLRHLSPVLSLRLLPQGSDRSARHLLKLILTNFRRRLPARSCRPALRGGQGDPQRQRPRPRLAHSFPIHSFPPLGQPLREPRPPGKAGLGSSKCRRTEPGMEPAGEPDWLGHSEHPPI